MARQIGPIEMVIGAGVNLHFDFGAAGNRAVKKSFAWDRRNPDVFGADQYHERNGSRPRWLLPLLVARCRIEGYRRPKIAPRQLGRPAKALRADREEKSATALRPAHYANAIRPNKRLRLEKQQRPVGVSRPIAIELHVGGSRRAHFPPATRGQSYRPSELHIHGGSARRPNRFLQARSSSPSTSPSTGHHIHAGRRLQDAAPRPSAARGSRQASLRVDPGRYPRTKGKCTSSWAEAVTDHRRRALTA